MAIDGFMEITDQGKPIKGETLDKTFGNSKHRACSIISFDIKMQQQDKDPEPSGESNTITPGGTPNDPDESEKPNSPLRFSVKKEVDMASSTLFAAYCKHVGLSAQEEARHAFDKVRITVRKAAGLNPLVFLVFEFKEVYVSEYSVNVDEAKVATESLTFKAMTGTMQYRTQKSEGLARPQIAGWTFSQPPGPADSL